MNYETPTISELGSVAAMTRGDDFALKWDGFHNAHILGVDPSS